MADNPAALRRGLKRTWFPFFSRFGRLTEVQRLTIPRLLSGENVVVISPSASGKTEAAAAPLCERLLERGRGGLAVLYVTPTRALVNDLFRRLQDPVESLGLALGRKTGDHPSLDAGAPPDILITTPESFDSLLCRKPALFEALRAVVLDELHLLDNSPRGDQLRALLERLRLVNPGVQYCALSATIDDPGIGARYFPDPRVVKVPERRAIESRLVALDEDWAGRAVAELKARGCRKALVFFNSRSWAESAVKQLALPPFEHRVWVHHASLNRKVREEVEATMNRERSGILCCTSTLELGIDIGDVDAVVLVRPPFDISSLLQRIGRGNRRTGGSLFTVGFYTDGWERFLFESFLEAAATGTLGERRYTVSLAVLPQQVVSYLFQRRRIGATEAAVERALGPVFGADRVREVFRHLAGNGTLVETRAGVYQLGSALERELRYGKVHSNIQEKSFGKYEVYDADSNRHLGTVFFVFRSFLLGGRVWQTVGVREAERRVLVRPAPNALANPKVFEGTGTSGYGYRVAALLRRRLFPELGDDALPCFRDGDRTFVIHLLGPTYGFLLGEALGRDGVEAEDLDGRLMALGPGAAGERFPLPSEAALRSVARDNLVRFEDGLGSGAFLRLLPPELQVEDHLLALDTSGLVEHLAGLRLAELDRRQVRERVRGFAGVDTNPADASVR